MDASLKRKRPPVLEIPNILTETNTNKPLHNHDLPTPRNDAVCFGGNGVGVFAVKGKKKFMEDTHKIVSCLPGRSTKRFFGVYDGHGGRTAAEFAADNLHNNIAASMDNYEENLFVEEAVKEGYLKTDQEFLKQGLNGGACCVTALIKGHEIIISNVGDCRAVLCRGGTAEALTKDHTAEREDEQQRIEDKGGYVEFHRGAWRVHGVLSVSRSIGDAHLKQWVLAEPDTRILYLTPDMEFLILASDGLWGEVGNQEAIDIVLSFVKTKKKTEEIEYGRVNVSPSSKLRRVSLVKQQKEGFSRQSPGLKKSIHKSKDTEENFSRENESPPSKSRRISLVKKVNIKANTTPQEKSTFSCKSACNRLMAASKELVNLAVNRGSLDDVTVMIIDLKQLGCNS